MEPAIFLSAAKIGNYAVYAKTLFRFFNPNSIRQAIDFK